MTSVNTSFMAFVLTVFIYLVFNTTTFEDKDLDKWWFYVKWIIFLCFLLLIVSVISLFNALQNYIQWNVPNQYVLENGCSTNVWKILGNTQSSNIWGQTISNYTGWALGTGLPCLFLLSLAIYAKNK